MRPVGGLLHSAGYTALLLRRTLWGGLPEEPRLIAISNHVAKGILISQEGILNLEWTLVALPVALPSPADARHHREPHRAGESRIVR